MLPCHSFVPSEFAALVYSTDFVTFFFLGERTIIVKEDSIRAQPDGPVSFSGLLTGIRVIDSCNWEHPGWGLMKASLHVWRDSSNKYGRLIEPLEGVFRVLYLLMKQDIDSKLSSSDWPRNEIKGDQGPWSGRKVTDSCCLFSRPLHHSYNGRTNVTNCWSNLRQWRPCVSWGTLLPPGGYGFINRN